MAGVNRCVMLVNPSLSKVRNAPAGASKYFRIIPLKIFEVDRLTVNQGGNAGNSRPCFWGREFFILRKERGGKDAGFEILKS